MGRIPEPKNGIGSGINKLPASVKRHDTADRNQHKREKSKPF